MEFRRALLWFQESFLTVLSHHSAGTHSLAVSPNLILFSVSVGAGDVVSTLGLASLATAISQETDASSWIFKLPSERLCVPTSCGSCPWCGLLGLGSRRNCREIGSKYNRYLNFSLEI